MFIPTTKLVCPHQKPPKNKTEPPQKNSHTPRKHNTKQKGGGKPTNQTGWGPTTQMAAPSFQSARTKKKMKKLIKKTPEEGKHKKTKTAHKGKKTPNYQIPSKYQENTEVKKEKIKTHRRPSGAPATTAPHYTKTNGQRKNDNTGKKRIKKQSPGSGVGGNGRRPHKRGVQKHRTLNQLGGVVLVVKNSRLWVSTNKRHHGRNLGVFGFWLWGLLFMFFFVCFFFTPSKAKGKKLKSFGQKKTKGKAPWEKTHCKTRRVVVCQPRPQQTNQKHTVHTGKKTTVWGVMALEKNVSCGTNRYQKKNPP